MPPKGFFPSPKPDNLITVLCCARCNSDYSKDDEAIRAWFSSLLGRSTAGDWIFEHKVLRGIAVRSPKFREALLSSLKDVKLETEEGIIDAAKFTVPWERVERFVIRCVKGLLTFHFPDYDYSHDKFEMLHIPPIAEELKKLEPIKQYLTYDERGEGVFQYRRGLTDTKESGMWILSFYQAILFVVVHSKHNLRDQMGKK